MAVVIAFSGIEDDNVGVEGTLEEVKRALEVSDAYVLFTRSDTGRLVYVNPALVAFMFESPQGG